MLTFQIMFLESCSCMACPGPNSSRFRPSCVRIVCFLRKSTEFHVMRTECQRILINFLIIFLMIRSSDRSLSAALFHIRSLYSLPDHSPIAPVESCLILPSASVYPPIFDALEWMEMQTGLPLSGLLKLFCRTTPLPQRLQT